MDDTQAAVHAGVLLSAPTLQSPRHFVEIPPVCRAQLVHSDERCTSKQFNKLRTTLLTFSFNYGSAMYRNNTRYNSEFSIQTTAHAV